MKKIYIKMKKVLKLIANDIWSLKIVVPLLFITIEGLKYLWGAMCPMVIVTGLPCPGCGLTRALISVFKLDFSHACEYNASIYLWIFVAVWWSVFRYIYEKKAPGMSLIIAIVILITIIYYLVRMFNCFPDTPPLTYQENNIIGNTIKEYSKVIHLIWDF